MNSVQILGRICNDIELRYSQNQMAIAQITVAVNRPKKNGEDQGADFIRCNLFGNQAENLQKYCQKGNRVLVEGRLRTGSYDKNGEKVYFTDVNATRVEFIDFNQKTRQNENESVTEGYYEQRYGNQGFKAVDSADIPF